MSYRCNVCEAKVQPGLPLRRHVVLRPDRSILREVPVCHSCEGQLKDGWTLSALSQQYQQLRSASVTVLHTQERVEETPPPAPRRPLPTKPVKLFGTTVLAPTKAVEKPKAKAPRKPSAKRQPKAK